MNHPERRPRKRSPLFWQLPMLEKCVIIPPEPLDVVPGLRCGDVPASEAGLRGELDIEGRTAGPHVL